MKTYQTKLAFQFAVTAIHYFTYYIACTWPFLGRYTIFVIFLMHNLCIVKQFCCFVSFVYVTDSQTNQCHITLNSAAQPVNLPVRRILFTMRDGVKAALDKMVDDGVI